MKYGLVLIISYLLGSVPFGLLIAQLWAGIDVRKEGSGNIGVTNVLRIVGFPAAFLTLLGDCGKGIAAVLLAKAVVADPFLWLLAGTGAVIGHNWPVFLGFKGGKGIATTSGVLLVLWPLLLLGLASVWLVVLLLFRYISLASVIAAFSFPILLFLFGASWRELLLGALVATFTIYKHRSNLQRLIAGTEFRIGEKVNS